MFNEKLVKIKTLRCIFSMKFYSNKINECMILNYIEILNKSNLIFLHNVFGINTESLKNDSHQCGFKTSLDF